MNTKVIDRLHVAASFVLPDLPIPTVCIKTVVIERMKQVVGAQYRTEILTLTKSRVCLQIFVQSWVNKIDRNKTGWGSLHLKTPFRFSCRKQYIICKQESSPSESRVTHCIQHSRGDLASSSAGDIL